MHNRLCIQGISRDLKSQFYIFQCGQVRNQVIELENETDVISPVARQLLLGITGDVLSVHQDFSSGGLVHAAEDI